MITTLIFDWGGVLTRGKHTDGITRILERKFKTPEGEDKNNRERVAKLVDMIDYKGSSFHEFVEEVNNEFNINATVEEMTTIFSEAIIPNTEAIEFLNYLKQKGKYKIVLLSDNNETTIKIIKTFHKDMLLSFEKTYFSCEVKMHKPESRFFEYVLADLNLKPEECVFIDDQEKNTKAAASLGIKSIIFKDLEQVKNELNTLHIDLS